MGSSKNSVNFYGCPNVKWGYKVLTKNKIIFIFALFLTGYFLIAEENEQKSPESFNNALGFYGNTLAGDPTGGLHYQHWGKRFGWQCLISALYNPEATFDKKLDYSIIADGLFSVYENKVLSTISGRLYVWASAGHRGYITTSYSSNGYLYNSNDETKETHAYNILLGFGIGIETVAYEHFSFPFQFGYYASFPSEPKISFSIGSGFRYRF